MCLNPFTRITDIKKETEILLPLLGKMAKPNEGLNDIQNAALTEAIRLVFTKKGNESDIDDIIEFLWNQNGQLADVQHELAVLLTPFAPADIWAAGSKARTIYARKPTIPWSSCPAWPPTSTCTMSS